MTVAIRQNFEDILIGQEFIFGYEIDWQTLKPKNKNINKVLPYIISFIKTSENSYKSLKISEIFADNGKNERQYIQVNHKGICYGKAKVVVVG